MANFIVSYDLNGPHPTHAEMDQHLHAIVAWRGRVLETVWYVAFPGTQQQLFEHVRSILSPNDRLLVVEALDATFINLLATTDSLVNAWNESR